MKEVAVGIILREGRVLACQRKQTARYPLKWEFPGGKIEPGESGLQTLRRELHEELSLQPLSASEFHRQEWIYPEATEGSPSDSHFRVTYFLVDGYRGEPQNHAFESIAWVTPAQLRQMDILEGNREVVNLLIRHEQSPQEAG